VLQLRANTRIAWQEVRLLPDTSLGVCVRSRARLACASSEAGSPSGTGTRWRAWRQASGTLRRKEGSSSAPGDVAPGRGPPLLTPRPGLGSGSPGRPRLQSWLRLQLALPLPRTPSVGENPPVQDWISWGGRGRWALSAQSSRSRWRGDLRGCGVGRVCLRAPPRGGRVSRPRWAGRGDFTQRWARSVRALLWGAQQGSSWQLWLHWWGVCQLCCRPERRQRVGCPEQWDLRLSPETTGAVSAGARGSATLCPCSANAAALLR